MHLFHCKYHIFMQKLSSWGFWWKGMTNEPRSYHHLAFNQINMRMVPILTLCPPSWWTIAHCFEPMSRIFYSSIVHHSPVSRNRFSSLPQPKVQVQYNKLYFPLEKHMDMVWFVDKFTESKAPVPVLNCHSTNHSLALMVTIPKGRQLTDHFNAYLYRPTIPTNRSW